MPLTIRELDGSPLTNEEFDTNFCEKVTLAAHGNSVGDLVYIGATKWEPAVASAFATVADGIVAGVSGDDFWVVTLNGTFVTWTHGLGGNPGDVIYLSQSTPKAATLTKPGSGVIQPVGKVRSASVIKFEKGYLA